MRGTKLWQAAGSPLIQGRSLHERAFGWELATAIVLALAAGLAADVAVPWPARPIGALAGALRRAGVAELAGAVVAASLAVGFSRAARIGRPWLVGAVCASLATVGVVWSSGGFVR